MDGAGKKAAGTLPYLHGFDGRHKPWRKYTVIYKSVLLENLQYVANVALGFFTYFVFIYIYIRLWGYMYQTPGRTDCGLHEGADDLVCDDDGDAVFRLQCQRCGKGRLAGISGAVILLI